MHHAGSCHCGAVAIEVDAPPALEAYECNCSMCRRTGFLHLIVPAQAFTLVSGDKALSLYTFNTGIAKHFFFRHCGCRPFYIPRSNPNGYSVNVRCLDPTTIESVSVTAFDGQRWEANAGRLAHLSQ